MVRDDRRPGIRNGPLACATPGIGAILGLAGLTPLWRGLVHPLPWPTRGRPPGRRWARQTLGRLKGKKARRRLPAGLLAYSGGGRWPLSRILGVLRSRPQAGGNLRPRAGRRRPWEVGHLPGGGGGRRPAGGWPRLPHHCAAVGGGSSFRRVGGCGRAARAVGAPTFPSTSARMGQADAVSGQVCGRGTCGWGTGIPSIRFCSASASSSSPSLGSISVLAMPSRPC